MNSEPLSLSRPRRFADFGRAVGFLRPGRAAGWTAPGRTRWVTCVSTTSPFGPDAEVGRNEPSGSGEAALAPGHFPDDRASLIPLDPTGSNEALAHRPEGQRRRPPIGDPAGLDEGPRARHLHLRLEPAGVSAACFHARLDPGLLEGRPVDLTPGGLGGHFALRAGHGGRTPAELECEDNWMHRGSFLIERFAAVRRARYDADIRIRSCQSPRPRRSPRPQGERLKMSP